MLVAPFFLAAGLLFASGIGKILRPAPAVDALAAAGLPGGAVAARALGVVEVLAGAAALWRPTTATALVVAALYLAFALFLVRLIRRGGATTCGCVGSGEAPPSWLHVALDLAAVAVSVAAAAWGVPSLGSAVAASPMAGVPLLIVLVGAGALLAIAVVEVPRAWASYRPEHDEHVHTAPPGPRPIALVERPP
jgi:Methylamine utilisation protein MauE